MNGWERVRAAVSHRDADRPPVEWLGTDEVVANLCGYLGLGDEEAVLSRLGVDFRRFYADVDKEHAIPEDVAASFAGEGALHCSCYGVVLLKNQRFPQGHRVHGPFYRTNDLDAFRWPVEEDVRVSEHASAEMQRCNQDGLCTVIACDNPFKIASFMLPYDQFLIDCIEDPDFISELMHRILTVELARAMAGVRAGARATILSGDFADGRSLMISPSTFRRVLKPVLTQYVDSLRALKPDLLFFLHSDGNLNEALPDLIECGFHAVHPIQPECMDMAAVKARFGKSLTIWGGISVQSEMPFMKATDVRSLVRRRIKELSVDGGFMFAPSNTILPDVPVENILVAFEEAGRTQRP